MAKYILKRFSRQKEFTRAEKQAFLEMYRKLHNNNSYINQKLKNGRYHKSPVPLLPDTSHPRDVLRLNKLAGDWNDIVRGRGTGNVDFQSARTLFKNAGMPKMADQVEKIANKYSNNAAINRLRRIKEINPRFVQKFEKVNKNTQRHLRNLEAKGKIMGEMGSKQIEVLREYNPSEYKDLKALAGYAKGIRGKGKYASRIPVENVYMNSKEDGGACISSSIGTNSINGRAVGYKDPDVLMYRNTTTSELAHEIGHHKTHISPYGLDILTANARQLDYNKPAPAYWGNDTLPVTIARNLVNVVSEKSANSYAQALLNRMKLKNYMPALSEANQMNYTGYVGLNFRKPGVIG